MMRSMSWQVGKLFPSIVDGGDSIKVMDHLECIDFGGLSS
jgi:hypothetical protein